MPASDFLDRAGRWLLDSGIQEPSGGVARYYRTDLGRNHPISTEITGYHASALIYLYSVTNDSRYLDRARATADFLVGAWDASARAFPFEPSSELAFFFDSGIIIRGLLSVWRITAEPALLALARDAALAMVEDFASDRDFHPILRLPSKAPLAREPRWSRLPGCYQLKSAMSWNDVADETGDEVLRGAYLRLLAQALETHADFLSAPEDEHVVMDRLHAYCYFLEGLLPCVQMKPVADVFAAGMVRVAELLRRIAPAFARSDVYAQLLRARLFGAISNVVPLDWAAAQLEARQLAEFQAPDGGFWFGQKDGAMLPYMNPVSTAFAVQALEMWRHYRGGSLSICRTLLV